MKNGNQSWAEPNLTVVSASVYKNEIPDSIVFLKSQFSPRIRNGHIILIIFSQELRYYL